MKPSHRGHVDQRTQDARRISNQDALALLGPDQYESLCATGAIRVGDVTFAQRLHGKSVLAQGTTGALDALDALLIAKPADPDQIEAEAVEKLRQDFTQHAA